MGGYTGLRIRSEVRPMQYKASSRTDWTGWARFPRGLGRKLEHAVTRSQLFCTIKIHGGEIQFAYHD